MFRSSLAVPQKPKNMLKELEFASLNNAKTKHAVQLKFTVSYITLLCKFTSLSSTGTKISYLIPNHALWFIFVLKLVYILSLDCRAMIDFCVLHSFRRFNWFWFFLLSFSSSGFPCQLCSSCLQKIEIHGAHRHRKPQNHIQHSP